MNSQESKVVEANTDTVTEQRGWCGNGVASSREKNLVIVGFVFGLLVLCLLCAIIMTIILGLLFPKQEYCFTPHCVKKAGSILKAMNMSANPCQNFFNFVCGGWVDEYDVDEGSEIAIFGKIQTKVYRKFDRIIENVKSSQDMSLNRSTDNSKDVAYAGVKAIKTYDACCSLYDDYHPENIAPLMEGFGGWPMATTNWADDGSTIEKKLNVVLGDFGVSSLFSINVTPNDDDPTKNIITISEPVLSSITDNLLKIIVNIAKNTTTDKQGIIDADIEEIKNFVTNITEKMALATETEVKTTVGELDKHLTGMKIDWVNLHELLLEGGNQNAGKITKLKVVLRNKEVINEVLSLAKALSPRTINNYFAIQIILSHPLLIIKDIQPGIDTKKSSLTTANVLTTLKETCLQTVAQYLNFAMDHVFVYNQNNATEMAEDLIYYVREAFMKLIEHYDWLDSSTRAKLKKKLDMMNKYVDYPKWLNNKKEVDDYYKDYKYNDSSPVAAYVNMIKFGNRKMFATYKEIADRNTWPKLTSFSISTVNAFYIPHQNNFVLPRAILSPPIYDEKNPKYLTFGSIGAIIGHEITHGFDSNGRHHDETGKLSKNVWSSASTNKYDKLSKCFVDQYSKYVVDQTSNTTVNGNKTLGENIADNGGLRQAYIAYHMWLREANKGQKELPLPGLAAYSPEQMFFISYGQTWCISAGKGYLRNQVKTDEHTPNYYRVIGTLSNSKAFANAFDCSTTSSMNAVDKCVLW